MNELQTTEIRPHEDNYNFERFTSPIALPKSLLIATETIMTITALSRDELFNRFIVSELDNFSFDFDALLRIILENGSLLEQLRVGINHYYGKEKHEKKQKQEEKKETNKNYGIIDVMLTIPKKLMNFVNAICKLSKIQKEYFFSYLILAHCTT